MNKIYKHTLNAAHLGYVVQAININFAPLLFLTFQSQYQMSLDKISLLILINFLTQLVTDLVAAAIVDKIGYKQPAILAHILAATGLILLAVLPGILDPFTGLGIAVFIYAMGGGLLEVLLSPIVESVPTENKEKEMIKLFAFYSWGQVFVVAASTLFFFLIGMSNWKILAMIWAIVPIVNGIYFACVKIDNQETKETAKAPLKELFSQKMFWIFLAIMFLTGAAEQGISQWASTIAEQGLGISKTLGDLLGPTLYAVMMGLTRIFYIQYGHKFKLAYVMFGSGILSVISFLMIALSPNPMVAIIGCGLCGISMGTLWPGAIRRASIAVKNGGGRMFALLAFLGDIGCAMGPAFIGFFANQSDIRFGMLLGTIFPVLLVIALYFSLKNRKDIL